MITDSSSITSANLKCLYSSNDTVDCCVLAHNNAGVGYSEVKLQAVRRRRKNIDVDHGVGRQVDGVALITDDQHK